MTREFEKFFEDICCENYIETPYTKTPMYEEPVSKSFRYIIDNSKFLDVRLAHPEDGVYKIIVSKAENRQLTRVWEADATKVKSQEVHDVLEKAVAS